MTSVENENSEGGEQILIRPATEADRERVIEVEAETMPNWRYLPWVFDMFMADQEAADQDADQRGEFCVAEVEGKLVACGKFTVLPDGSAWLETLRVTPDYQGRGIGKRLYRRFFEIAEQQNIATMRMYTGVSNVVSKGLAERFGFRLAGTYRGATTPCQSDTIYVMDDTFHPVSDPERATELLMAYGDQWDGFMVINRTFYAITPALCAELAAQGMVYEDPASQSVIALGARFMPHQALHIGLFGGDERACLAFAMQKGVAAGAAQVSCFFPPSATGVHQSLLNHGYQTGASDLIVMEVHMGMHVGE